MRTIRFTLLTLVSLFIITASSSSQLVWNHACRFEGTPSSYLAVPNTNAAGKNLHQYLLRPVTLECWIMPENSLQPDKQTLIQKGTANTPAGFEFYLEQGKPSVKVNNTKVLSSAAAVPSNKWSHVAAVYDNLTGKWYIYINGVLTAEQFTSYNKIPNADSLYIGKGSSSPYKGFMDEVRMWSKAQTAADISAAYRTTLATYSGFNGNYSTPNDLSPNSVYTGLLLSLTFQDDEQSGPVFSMSDWSGCGFNAKNNGAADFDMSHNPSPTIMQNECLDMTAGGYVAAKDIPQNNPSSQITIEFWVYLTLSSTYLELAEKPGSFWIRTIYGNKPRIKLNGTTDVTCSNFQFDQLKWNHFAFTYDAASGQYKFYKNGVMTDNGVTNAGNLKDVADSLYLGNSPANSWIFNGYIDEFRISNYVKSSPEINAGLYTSYDLSNIPNINASRLCYGFDGYAVDNLGQANSTMFFRKNAKFSNPAAIDDIPVSPVNRSDEHLFPHKWHISSYIGLRIPEFGMGGEISSELQVSAPIGFTINDVNVFVALNHTNEGDLNIRLVSPYNDTMLIYSGQPQAPSNDNLVAIFDEQADSTMNKRYTSFGPSVRPAKKITSPVGGKSPMGKWKLIVTDNGNAADVGYLYTWGLQFNNGDPMMNKSGNETETTIAGRFSLEQNFPNPFNPATGIKFTIPENGKVKLTVFDITGKTVSELVNREMEAGVYEESFNAGDLSSGVYFYKLETGTYSETKKMILVK